MVGIHHQQQQQKNKTQKQQLNTHYVWNCWPVIWLVKKKKIWSDRIFFKQLFHSLYYTFVYTDKIFLYF